MPTKQYCRGTLEVYGKHIIPETLKVKEEEQGLKITVLNPSKTKPNKMLRWDRYVGLCQLFVFLFLNSLFSFFWRLQKVCINLKYEYGGSEPDEPKKKLTPTNPTTTDLSFTFN